MQYYNDYNDMYRKGPENYQRHSSGEGYGFFESIRSFFEMLFSNPGKSLQVLAIVDCVGLILAGMACAVYLARDSRGDFAFWQAVGFVLGGIIGGYLTSIPLYAFGRFVEDTADNKATLYRIEKQMQQMNKQIETANKRIEEEKKREISKA